MFEDFEMNMPETFKEDILSPDYVDMLLDDDALDPQEAAFLQGYTS